MTPSQRFKSAQPMCAYWAGSEWFSYALEGLWRACESFDAERGTTFQQWAYLKINGFVADAKRVASMVPRRQRERGVANPGDLLEWMHPTPFPDPEVALIRKERVVALRRCVASTFGNEGALLRASVLEQEHQDVAERRGLSKSWMSRLNSRAEKKLAWQLRDFAP
jgi:DNA-directed RNA polymerase specialized sigma24 family protein